MRRPVEALNKVQKEQAIYDLDILIKMKSYIALSPWMKALSIACVQSVALPATDAGRRKHSTCCPELGPGPLKCNIADFISLLRSPSAQTAMDAHPTRSPRHPCTFVTVISTMGTQCLTDICCLSVAVGTMQSGSRGRRLVSRAKGQGYDGRCGVLYPN